MWKLLALYSGLALVAAGPQLHVAFDAAGASSTYSAGNLAGSPAFAAQQAPSSGSVYGTKQACTWAALQSVMIVHLG